MEQVSSPNKQPALSPAIKFGTLGDEPSSPQLPPPSGLSAADNVVLPPRIQSAPPNALVSGASSADTSAANYAPSAALPVNMSAETRTTDKSAGPAGGPATLASKKPLTVNAAPYQPSAVYAPPPPYYASAYYGYGGGRPGPKIAPATSPYHVAAHDPMLQYATTLFMSGSGTKSAVDGEKPAVLPTPVVSASPGLSSMFTPPPARKPVRIQNPETGEDVKITTTVTPKLAASSPSAPNGIGETADVPVSPAAAVSPNVPAAPIVPQPTTPVKRSVSIKDPAGNVVELVGKKVEPPKFSEAVVFPETMAVKPVELRSSEVDKTSEPIDASKPIDARAAEAVPVSPPEPAEATKCFVPGRPGTPTAACASLPAADEDFVKLQSGNDQELDVFDEEDEEAELEEIPMDGLIKRGMLVTYPSRFVGFDIPQAPEDVWRYTRRFLLQFMTICTQRPDKAAEMARLAAVQQRAQPRGRRAPRRVYSEAEKQAYLSQLSRAEHAWTPVTDTAALADNERLVRTVTGILNKLSIDNFSALFDELKVLRLHARPDDAVKSVIDVIFEKATMEVKFAELYATLCHRLCVFEVECVAGDDEKAMAWRASPFGPPPVVSVQRSRLRVLLVGHVECEYNRKREWSEEQLRLAAQGKHVKALASGDLTDDDLAMIKKKRRVLGNMCFIGELYKQKLISPKIMHDILRGMLGPRGSVPVEDEIECVCRLFSTVAPSLWELTHMLSEPAMKRDFVAAFALYIARLHELNASPALTSRVRFMIMDVLEAFDRSMRTSNSPSLASCMSSLNLNVPATPNAPSVQSAQGAGNAGPGPTALAQRFAAEKRRGSRDYAGPPAPATTTPATCVAQPPQGAQRDDVWSTSVSSSASRATPTPAWARPASSPLPVVPLEPASALPPTPVSQHPQPHVQAQSSAPSAPKKLSTAAMGQGSKGPSPSSKPISPSPPLRPAADATRAATLPQAFAPASNSGSSSSRLDAPDVEAQSPKPADKVDSLADAVSKAEIYKEVDDPAKDGVPERSRGFGAETLTLTLARPSEQERAIDGFLANYGGEYFTLKSPAELVHYACDVRDWTQLLCRWLPYAAEHHGGVRHFEELFVPAFRKVIVDGGHARSIDEGPLRTTLMGAAEMQSDFPLVFDYYGLFLARCYGPQCLAGSGGAVSGKLLRDRLLSLEDGLTSGRLLAAFLKHAGTAPEPLPVDMSHCPVDVFRQHVAVFEIAGVLSAFPRLAKWRFEREFGKLRADVHALTPTQLGEAVRALIVAVPSNVLREANLLGDICQLLFGAYREHYVLRSSRLTSPGAPSPQGLSAASQRDPGAMLLHEEWLPQFLATLSPILATEDMRPQDWRAMVLAAAAIEDEDSAFGCLLMQGLGGLDVIPAPYFDLSYTPSPTQSPTRSKRGPATPAEPAGQ